MHIRFTHIAGQSELFFYIPRLKLYHLSKTTSRGGFKFFMDEGPFPIGWDSDMKNWSASATSISTMEGVIEVIRAFVHRRRGRRRIPPIPACAKPPQKRSPAANQLSSRTYLSIRGNTLRYFTELSHRAFLSVLLGDRVYVWGRVPRSQKNRVAKSFSCLTSISDQLPLIILNMLSIQSKAQLPSSASQPHEATNK